VQQRCTDRTDQPGLALGWSTSRSWLLRSAFSTVSDVHAFGRLHRGFTRCVISHPGVFGARGKMAI
jgi:hypothetical protein